MADIGSLYAIAALRSIHGADHIVAGGPKGAVTSHAYKLGEEGRIWPHVVAGRRITAVSAGRALVWRSKRDKAAHVGIAIEFDAMPARYQTAVGVRDNTDSLVTVIKPHRVDKVA